MVNKCIICEKEFEKYSKNYKSKGARAKTKRAKNSINCSRKCSKIYNRIHKHLYWLIEKKFEEKYGKH